MERIYDTKWGNRHEITKWSMSVLGFVLMGFIILIIGTIVATNGKYILPVNTDFNAVAQLLNNLFN